MWMNSRLLLTAFAASWLAAAPALAQDADLRGLSERPERLGNDIKDIQLYIFRGEDPAASIMEAGAEQDRSGTAEMAARLEVRFGEVEDQFRSLTGQIEEIAHRIGVVAKRVEKLVSDVDFRLSEIEQAQAEALAFGRTDTETAALGVAPNLVAHQAFPGDRPSTVILLPELSASTLGQLVALYEHRTVVQAAVWGINPFDQWGVELGKQLATRFGDLLADRKSTRLNSSHKPISYAVFCLRKKKKKSQPN